MIPKGFTEWMQNLPMWLQVVGVLSIISALWIVPKVIKPLVHLFRKTAPKPSLSDRVTLLETTIDDQLKEISELKKQRESLLTQMHDFQTVRDIQFKTLSDGQNDLRLILVNVLTRLDPNFDVSQILRAS